MLLSLRTHPSAQVRQVRAALAAEGALSPASLAATELHHPSGGLLPLHATLDELGITRDSAPPLLLFFRAGAGADASEAEEQQDDPFDLSSVPAEEVFTLRVQVANMPPSLGDANAEARESVDAAPARRSSASARRASAGSVPASASAVSSRSSPALASSPSPPLALSSVVDDLAAGGGVGVGSSRSGAGDGEEGEPEQWDTARRFLEDDGDIASQWSDDGMQQETQGADTSAATAAAVDVTLTTPAVSGLVKGQLLDGYRLLRAARVDLPEQAVRVRLPSCTPALVDAVPEHLAEFSGLTSLDLSGNNVPLDRLRLLHALEELDLSCNSLRDLDFAPLPGVHYELESDPAEVAACQWLIEDVIGFHSLTKLNLSYNYLSQQAIVVLSVLPRLRSLDLSANDLVHLPPDLSSFWKLTKLSLRNNRLGSGSLARKQRALHEWSSSGPYSASVDGKRRPKPSALTRPLSARSEASEIGPEEDPDEAYRKERRLFQSLSTLPALVELDLSENLISCVPEGCIPPGPASFPKLQFLNLALNQVEHESDVLPLAELPNLEWLDLRGNPFIASSRPSRRERAGVGGKHALLPAETVPAMDYATRFPALNLVLVQRRGIRVVMSKPRHNNQTLQTDLSHILQPAPPSATTSGGAGGSRPTSAFTGRLSAADPLAREAADARERRAARRILASLEPRRPIPLGDTLYDADEKDTMQPNDSLQQLISEQQSKMQQQRSQLQLPEPAPAPNVYEDEEDDEEYGDAGDAYSSTFLTGVTAADLQSTPAFAGSVQDVGTSRVRRLPTESFQAKQRGNHATAALQALLSTAHVPLAVQARPTRRVEAERTSLPREVHVAPLPSASASRVRPPPSSPFAPRGATRPAVSTTHPGLRQPRVAQVYARMESVLASIEAAHGGGVSSTAAASPSPAARRPNVRGVPSSAYVDPVHARTQDRVRARRQREREQNEVHTLLQTVAQVSKVVL